MLTHDAKTIATDMLKAWTTGDFARTRALLHDGATFNGPLGETRGADAYVDGVRKFASTIQRAAIHKVIAEGSDVCVIYDLITKDGTVLPTVGVYEVTNGRVASVRAYFDPRPITRQS